MGAKIATTKTAATTKTVAKSATATKAAAVKKVPATKAPAKTAVAPLKAVAKPAPAPVAAPPAAPVARPAAAPVARNGAALGGKSMKVPSEAEILAAPEKDYMNSGQLQFFKLRLQTMEQEILHNADQTTEHLRESIIVPDPADRATIEEEHALELRTRDRERKLLKKIQQSIQRIDSGDYGYCEETGDPIGVPRLLARPTATLSLEAQERREMKQKMYGE
jgi:DnaK suppressor protein